MRKKVSLSVNEQLGVMNKLLDWADSVDAVLPTLGSAAASGRLGGLWAGNGDSMMAGQNGRSSSPYWETCILSAGRIQSIGNMSVGGTNTLQAFARFDADLALLPRIPDVYLLWFGYNDVGLLTLAQTRANIEAYVDRCIALKIQPILLTIPGRINGATTATKLQTAQINLIIRAIGAGKGVRVIDIAPVLNDPFTGLVKTIYNFDNTHVNALGGRVLGQYILSFLSGDLPTWSVPMSNHNADATNLVVNGTMQDANADQKPDSWTVNVPGPVTIITNDPDFAGNAVKIDQVAAGGAINVFQDVTIGAGTFAIGDRLALSGRVKIVAEAGPLAAAGTFARATFLGAGGTGGGTSDWSTDIPNGAFYEEFVVPAATTGIRVAVQASSGTGSITAGQITMRNLTALAALGLT